MDNILAKILAELKRTKRRRKRSAAHGLKRPSHKCLPSLRTGDGMEEGRAPGR